MTKEYMNSPCGLSAALLVYMHKFVQRLSACADIFELMVACPMIKDEFCHE